MYIKYIKNKSIFIFIFYNSVTVKLDGTLLPKNATLFQLNFFLNFNFHSFNQHYAKYHNFTKFPGVKILWKGTVSTPGN